MVKGREKLGIHKANVFLSKSSVCSITPPPYRKLLAINCLFYFYTPTFLTCLGMLLSFFYTSFLISSYLGAVAIVI